MIPKIFHQIWLGQKQPPVRWMVSWLKHNPDFEYRLWTEKEVDDFGIKNINQLKWADEWNGKADIIRYEILNKYGGIYVDSDLECLRPLDSWLLEQDSFACYEDEVSRPGLIANTIIGCHPGNLVMQTCIKTIGSMSKDDVWKGELTTWNTVGPGHFTRVIQAIRYKNMAILPSFFFLPNHYSGMADYTGPFKPFAAHYFGSTPQSSINY